MDGEWCDVQEPIELFVYNGDYICIQSAKLSSSWTSIEDKDVNKFFTHNIRSMLSVDTLMQLLTEVEQYYRTFTQLTTLRSRCKPL